MLNQLLHKNFVMFALKAKLRVFEVIQKMVVEMIARVIFFAFGNFQTDACVGVTLPVQRYIWLSLYCE